MKRRFRLPTLSTWDVSVFFWILGIVLGTIAAVCFQISSGSGHAGLESVLAARLGQEIGDPSGAGWHLNAGMKAASRGTLFFQVWLQRSGMALMLWLAGMTPVACLAAWGACLVLGLEQAWLLAGFTGWGGFGDCLYLWQRYFHRWCFIFLCSGCFFPGRLQRRGGYGRLDF